MPTRSKQLRDAFAHRLAGRELVNLDRLGDHAADGQARVQRAVRILKYDLHALAKLAHVGRVLLEDGNPVEGHFARRDFGQAQDRARECRLAATALPHQAQRFAAIDLEAHAVDGLYPAHHARQHAAPNREVLAQVVDLEQHFAAARALALAGLRLDFGASHLARSSSNGSNVPVSRRATGSPRCRNGTRRTCNDPRIDTPWADRAGRGPCPE